MGGHELIKLMQVNAISGKRSCQLMRMLLTLDTYGTHNYRNDFFIHYLCHSQNDIELSPFPHRLIMSLLNNR